ncbi:hypothetical protein FisN_5Lh317 [Fistulifera solaris]|uniref:Transmembrane protein n=1 Tax=Fistulifera solaris TaxID=1519565 RepID=A0A1Z5KGI9_FISSO|nr:hypothetical protein FisN_5Lh317 [Fistulifera solaris]|eukprot:GAX25235.1 hypothetical protein FisN_5Lh317 [Fistulifera solaris]
MTRAILSIVTLLLAIASASAFVVQPRSALCRTSSGTSLGIFNRNKKEEEDLSFIESRDMTREEMLDLNKQNEEIMNAELIGMTAFSLIISIPMLYLVWVGFFSETAEIASDLPY